MRRRLQILVIGYNDDLCNEESRRVAYEVGVEIAKRGATLVTGGLGGVMEAASRGAASIGGLVVSIVPQKDLSAANPYSTVVIASGLGHMRNFVNVYSADGVIIVGGGAGTLSEVAEAYVERKPIVAVAGTGGIADSVPEYIDERKRVKIHRVNGAKEAVELLLKLIEEGTS